MKTKIEKTDDNFESQTDFNTERQLNDNHMNMSLNESIERKPYSFYNRNQSALV